MGVLISALETVADLATIGWLTRIKVPWMVVTRRHVDRGGERHSWWVRMS